MFIGHFALAFAAKRAAPAASLGTMILSCQLADLMWRLTRASATATALLVIAGVVVSHWVLDVASHRPDVPLMPGSETKLGFGLWSSRPATIAVEAVMLVGGLMMYVRTTTARDRTGTYALWGLVAFLVVINLANMFGPPPPSVAAVAWSAQAIWLLVAWGDWIDRHRFAKGVA